MLFCLQEGQQLRAATAVTCVKLFIMSHVSVKKSFLTLVINMSELSLTLPSDVSDNKSYSSSVYSLVHLSIFLSVYVYVYTNTQKEVAKHTHDGRERERAAQILIQAIEVGIL